MRHSKAFGISLCFLIMLQGCRSDYKDIDRRQYIVAIGLDKGKSGEFNLTLRGAIPQGQNPGTSTTPDTFDIFETSASSIGQAFQQVKQQFFLEPDFSHMKVVVFSEELVKQENILKYVDFFIRRRDFQDIAWVAVADKAKDIVVLHQKGERTAGDNLFMKFGEGVDTEFTPVTELHQMYKYSLTPGLTMYCPLLSVENNKIIARESALFDNNKRMKLKLNQAETKYFNLIKIGMRKGFIVLGPEKNFGLGVKHGKVTIHIKEEENNFLCDVHVKIDGVIEDTDLLNYTTSDLQDMVTKKLNKDISRLLLKLQKNQVDPFFLGLNYWSTNSKFTLDDHWLTDEYPNMKFQVHSDVKITRTGTLRWK
ncbi:Ger(x)C family spore germination protein [Paenibacillus agricola]|uniref:Ger(X)C family spore germination protein n=1 Tax=Paenibacillus agricola TaxID=2716264 RepID=A0ABX0JCP7_9BACL|nr:Ger(x)C family spore germination protein [Paenibacillus agricola]NHN33728.1 Ger(x)C family spore germination protein [Paenibacillus agricola]